MVAQSVSTYTPERAQTFFDVLAETGNVGKACAAIECTRRTAHNWRRDYAEFRAGWEEAMKVAVNVLKDEATRRAVEGVEEPVYQGGELVGTVRKYSDTLLIFMTKGADPTYRDRVAVTGEDGGPIQNEIIIRKMFVPPEGSSGPDQPAE